MKKAGTVRRTRDNATLLNTILEKQERLHHIRDLNTLLDSVLQETRSLTDADAGSIFLVEGKKLLFSYVQNDSLFKKDFLSNKYIYTNNSIDIDEKSIAGYVASTGESLMIEDAYQLDQDYPFSFNPYFDEISSYRTVSMLIVPIRTSTNNMVGVLELINRLSSAGDPIPFSSDQRFYITQFAFYAGIAIERALLLRDVVFKMVRTTELRDPQETQPHVSRVGSYAVELYQKWAERHGVPREEITNFKDILRISSMLHDIGKVGVSDAILKKREDLTAEEYESIKYHTVFGAQFFENPTSEWDTLAYEVALNHHERWDGGGYPGVVKDIHAKGLKFGPGKKGSAIPLSARIVTLADVYDALICKRAYKDAWEEDRVLFYIKEQSGRQFDPELVKVFFEIYEVIRAIREKWA
ncbi:MAG TPA: HD domain-containing phosphohydrolase [Spirochaetia bacterium]|nr:HD domain-containing phosphohydrolase [Spirochaetia bacterium]